MYIKREISFNAMSPCIRKGIGWLKGLLASSPALPSDKSRTKLKVKIKNWWNNTDSGKPKNTDKNFPQCHFVRQNLIWTRPESNPDFRVSMPVAKRLRLVAALKT